MAAPTRNSAGQLIGVLLVTGLLRTACARAGDAVGPPPGTPVALDSMADTADALARAEARRSRPLAADERLDPNTAPAEELDRLPGVGPATAEAVVAARDSQPFASVDELVRVRGIGPSTLARLAPHLEVRPGAARRLRPRATPLTAARPPTVDLNRAGPDELEALPGVGPVLARRIVDHRRTLGRFRDADQLLEVRGVGPALLEKLRPRVVVR